MSQHQNTMAAKDGTWTLPALHRPPASLPVLSWRTVSQHQNTMAAKDGSGPRPAAHGSKRCFLNSLETSSKLGLLPALHRPPASLLVFSWRTLSQHQNTMAAKDGSGPRPAAHGSKRCFLNSLETSSKLGLLPALHRPPASLLVFSWRTLSQHQNTMAAKDGSGPRPAAHRAKRCFLNCLEIETSFNPCFFLPSARVQGPCRRPQTPWQ